METHGMNIRDHFYPAVAMTVVLTALLGIIYPIVVTELAQVLFKELSLIHI